VPVADEPAPGHPYRPSPALIITVLVIVAALTTGSFLALRHPDPQPPDVHVLAAALGCTDLRTDRTEPHAAVSAECTLAGATTYITTFTDVVARDRWLADGSGVDDPHSRVVGDLWVIRPTSADLVPVVVTQVGGSVK